MEEKTKIQYFGLTEDLVKKSREDNGRNVLTPPKRDPWWKLFLEKFEDPIIRILLIAAAIAFVAGFSHGQYTESVGIAIAIFLATTMAFVNEYKAGKEFDILNKVNDDIEYKLIRAGDYCMVMKKDIVVGDILILDQGEELPVDCRVLECVALKIDESKITGESVPVSKYNYDKADSGATYPLNMLYRGTMVSEGHAIAEVTAVGDKTEIGITAREAAEETDEETPLNIQLEGLSKVIGVVGFGVAALLFIALSIHSSLIGNISMSNNQWIYTSCIIVSVLIALTRVWLPIIYDYFDVIGKPKNRPDWLESEGIVQWIKQFVVGLAVFVIWFVVFKKIGVFTTGTDYMMPYTVGQQFLQFFMIAITIIVVAVPEGLAMSVTLSLAYSMRKMTASNNLVRKMHACETIGAATVICTDKTGTLTKNEMSVYEIKPYKSSVISDDDVINFIYTNIAINSTANISQTGSALGNPTECAMLMYLCKRANVDYQKLRNTLPVIYQLPFSTENKFMATLAEINMANILLVKGAPEVVLNFCNIPPEEKIIELEKIKASQGRGMRVLGFAYICNPESKEDLIECVHDLSWLGFVSISDPIREDVPDAVKACEKAGIKVKIVTGDNKETAIEIGRQIGLVLPKDDIYKIHISGPEFESSSDEELKERLKDIKVLSRAKPLHKLRLVKLLQELGEVVAVTGDGTNDAPALNYANVGLSMGKCGTAVAKEASDIILLDDSFSSIVNATMWGRSLYQNIQRFILFQLTVNVAALIIALIGPFIGIELPLTVTQMLWVNLIMDTFAALALATEPPHEDVMSNKPRDSKAFIVTREMGKSILSYGIAFVIVLLTMLITMKADGITAHELSMFFSVFVFLQFWNLFNARMLGLKGSALSGFLQNKGFVFIALTIAIGQILMVQYGGEIFRTVPLSFNNWLNIIGGTAIVLLVGEVQRFYNKIFG